MNNLVAEILEHGVAGNDATARLRARLRAEGRLVEPPPPKGRVPTREEALEAARGWGSAVSEALEEDRAGR